MSNLNIDTDSKLQISPDQLVGARVAVLGSSGSGKSNCVAVLLEEILPHSTAGTIFDIHDEYWGLQEKFSMLRVGRSAPTVAGVKMPSPAVDVVLDPGGVRKFAEQAFHNKLPVIVNLAYYSEAEREQMVLDYCEALWELNKPRRFPYWVVLEEAHNFIPQKTTTAALDQLRQFAAEGRKFGFTVILASQRSSKVNKDILSECEFAFLHRINISNDSIAYQGMLPSGFNKNSFYNLPTGGAVVKWQHEGRARFDAVQIRRRHTLHVATTPGADGVVAELKTIALEQIDLSAFQQDPPAQPAGGEITPGRVTELEKLETNYQNACDELARVKRVNAWLMAAVLMKPVVSETGRHTGRPLREPAVETAAPVTGDKETKRQWKKFEATLRVIKNGARRESQIEVLKFLMRHEEQWFSAQDLARQMGYSETTMERWHPVYLCQQPLMLLERRREGGVMQYRSAAREVLTEQFPSLGVDEMVGKILGMG